MLNVWNGIGRLGKKPELKQGQSGQPYVSFSIAVERDVKNQDGKRDTDWIACVAFRQTAEYIAKYGDKGRMLCVSGRLQVREWATDTGKTQRPEVSLNYAQYIDSHNQSQQQPQQDGYQYQGQAGPQNAGYGGYQGGYGSYQGEHGTYR